jgi:hypothetical protein
LIIQWIQEKLIQRVSKTRYNTIKLNWKKAELEKLLANKDNMTPEEFKEAYRRLI